MLLCVFYFLMELNAMIEAGFKQNGVKTYITVTSENLYLWIAYFILNTDYQLLINIMQ